MNKYTLSIIITITGIIITIIGSILRITHAPNAALILTSGQILTADGVLTWAFIQLRNKK